MKLTPKAERMARRLLLYAAAKCAVDERYRAMEAERDALKAELGRWNECHAEIGRLRGEPLGSVNKPLAVAASYVLLKSRVAALTQALEEIEVNVSSNEHKPTSVLCNIGRIARAVLGQRDEGDGATHRCRVCGARWRLGDRYGWNLRSKTCGPCCDNMVMGDQIEPLPKRDEGET